jgi:metal-responsive CopG/Arc/MetJ family transcriptional regulator
MADTAQTANTDPIRGDEEEWDDTSVTIERRPTGNQVVSARLPTALVLELGRVADHLDMKLSELVRAAVEQYLRSSSTPVTVSAWPGGQLRVITPVFSVKTESANLVVPEPHEPVSNVHVALNA